MNISGCCRLYVYVYLYVTGIHEFRHTHTHIQILKYPRISTPMKFLQTRTVELHMEITKAVFGGFSFPEHLFPMQTRNGWMVGDWPFVSGIHKCMRTWLSLRESINQIDDFRGSILLYLADKFHKDGKLFPKDRAAGSLFWWSPEKLEGFLWPADMNPSTIFFGGLSLDTNWEWLSNLDLLQICQSENWAMILKFVSATLF